MNNKFSIYSSRMTNDLFKILEINLEETSEIERQIISAFAFGMINAYAIDEKIKPPKVHGTMIGVLINEFKYSEKQACEFAQTLINSTSREYHPTMYAIIHRGIQAYYDYKEAKEKEVYDNLTYIIDTIVSKQ
ncbi:Imm48 family immunity protein [Clostridium butanoliproducens]|uniref:Imm48 family immunity protein n=1 Tax=Clostridium butanoliproducens TaxID=2991837 RepID=UPI0024BAC48B|nr:Imm48 family immunity protein [Clostridium butanoliproducens]